MDHRNFRITLISILNTIIELSYFLNKDKKKTIGGGVALVVRNGLSPSLLPDIRINIKLMNQFTFLPQN